MDRRSEINQNINRNKEENWLDDLMERQERDLEEEEEILSTVPKRFRNMLFEEE